MPEDDISTMVAETIAEAELAAKEKARLAQEGDELFRADLPGGAGELVRRKQNTMVRSGNTPLPERVKFYRSRGGLEAWLPTVQLAHHLAKRHEDGTAVFVKERPGGALVPIDATCEVCVKRQGLTKVFYEEYDLIAHMETKHPREWRITKEKEQQSGGAFMQTLMAMDASERAAVQVLIGGSDGNGQGTASASEGAGAVGVQRSQQGEARVACPECGKSVKPRGLSIHQRRYCSSSTTSEGQ